MWAILKIDCKKISTLKNEFISKLGKDVKFYIPKLRIKKYFRSKVLIKERNLLGDYLLCFHKDLANKSIITSLNYCKGLKYFLQNFKVSQEEIQKFVQLCEDHKDKDGYIKQTFFEYKNKEKYEFISGPFMSLIFSILKENDFSIEALIGKYKLTVSKEDNLFRPV